MTELYTAVGKLEYRNDGARYPVVLIDGKENALDAREMIVWCCLNWNVLNIERLRIQVHSLETGENYSMEVDCAQCVARLVQRRLVAIGRGDTERDALSDLLLERTIAPLKTKLSSKLWIIFKAVFFNDYPLSVVFQALNRPRLSEGEHQILLYCRRNQHCTATDVILFGTEPVGEEKGCTTGSRIRLAKDSDRCCETVVAVANLLLKKQIIFAK